MLTSHTGSSPVYHRWKIRWAWDCTWDA